MTQVICGFEPLEDCCCLSTPRVLPRSVASMAFNFSAATEKAPLPEAQPLLHRDTPRAARQIFSRMDLFPAY